MHIEILLVLFLLFCCRNSLLHYNYCIFSPLLTCTTFTYTSQPASHSQRFFPLGSISFANNSRLNSKIMPMRLAFKKEKKNCATYISTDRFFSAKALEETFVVPWAILLLFCIFFCLLLDERFRWPPRYHDDSLNTTFSIDCRAFARIFFSWETWTQGLFAYDNNIN